MTTVGHTYPKPDNLIERGQMRRGNLVMCLHWIMAVDGRMTALGPRSMMEM